MRKQLNKSEIIELNNKILKFFSIQNFFGKRDNVALEEIDGIKFIKKENSPVFFYNDNRILPALKLILEKNILKEITVDAGAIKFVANGADVMRPGIKKIDPAIAKNEAIVIREEAHNKPLAVGIALFSGVDMQNEKSGRVIHTIHYIGDKIWKAG